MADITCENSRFWTKFFFKTYEFQLVTTEINYTYIFFNLSIFQSLLTKWLFYQIQPILPKFYQIQPIVEQKRRCSQFGIIVGWAKNENFDIKWFIFYVWIRLTIEIQKLISVVNQDLPAYLNLIIFSHICQFIRITFNFMAHQIFSNKTEQTPFIRDPKRQKALSHAWNFWKASPL